MSQIQYERRALVTDAKVTFVLNSLQNASPYHPWEVFVGIQFINSIQKGKAFFNKTKSLDHIQALVVKGNKILAKEGKEGTGKMLSKLKKKSDGILIKLPKKKQDLRMDLPTIGLQTFKDIKKYGLRGVVLQSKKNIFLDKTECIEFANKNKIFINII